MQGPISLYHSYKTWVYECIVRLAAEVTFRVAERRAAQHRKLKAAAIAAETDSDSDSDSDEDCPFTEEELADEVFCLVDEVMDGTRNDDPVCDYAIGKLLAKNPAAIGYVSIYCRERIHACRTELTKQTETYEQNIAAFLHRTSLIGEWLWAKEELSRWSYSLSTHAWIVGSNRQWLHDVYGIQQQAAVESDGAC